MASFLNRRSLMLVACIVVSLAGCAGTGGSGTLQVTLSGANEVPPVNTAATGFASFTIGEDRSVAGSVTATLLTGVVCSVNANADSG